MAKAIITQNNVIGTPFKKGNSGKPIGAVNKTTRMVKEVFADVFEELQNDPKVNLKAWGKNNPTEFYKLSSKLIPLQLNATVDANIKTFTYVLDDRYKDSGNTSIPT